MEILKSLLITGIHLECTEKTLDITLLPDNGPNILPTDTVTIEVNLLLDTIHDAFKEGLASSRQALLEYAKDYL